MFYLISFLWIIRTTKAFLLWLYLWQLKEYHLGRFLDHFRTEKGKKLFLNLVSIFKIILFLYALFLAFPRKMFSWQLYALWIAILTIIYLLESLKFFWDFIKKRLKKPIITQKSSILILTSLILEISFPFLLFQKLKLFYWFSFGLLSFDIIIPLISSLIVLFFQLPTIYLRNQIIKKAKEKREGFKNLLVIGITGSYGKTSTKEFLAEILSQKYRVLKTKEHQNSEMGISQLILNDLKPEHQIFVVEMGAYNRGGIKLLCDIVKPKIGILTGVNEQHLSTFGSMENLISAEGGKELIESLPQNGLIIFNGENNVCRKTYQEVKINKKIVFSSFSGIEKKFLPPDFWAENIKVEKEYLSFDVASKEGERANFLVNLLGAQNIENILLTISCARELGVNLEEISKVCQKLKPLPHQMELKKRINGLNIIDSTYSSNPDGVISHLEYLKIWPGKKVIIMPCLIELGKASKEVHKRIGKKIAQVCDLAIITTKEKFREIKEEAGEKTIFIEDPKKIFEEIKNFSHQSDVILLEGRLSAELLNLLTK